MENLGRTLQEFLREFDGIQVNFNFGSSAVIVAAYVFMALGLFAMAQNRGLKNPWLAWIPVANMWLLGCISDQYRYVTRGEQCSRRTKMLTLSIVETALILLICLLLILWAVILGLRMGSGFGHWVTPKMGITIAMALLPVLVFAVAAILLQIQKCCAFYDIFVSCEPESAKLMATWSIIASCCGIDLVAAILIFTCRNKEKGMPPRKIQ